MHYIRPRYLLVIPLLAMLLLSACGSSTTPTSSTSGPGALDPKKNYTADFWEVFDTGANKTALVSLTNEYMKAHPNVKINLDAYDSYGMLDTKLNAAIAAHKPPAIAQVYETWAS